MDGLTYDKTRETVNYRNSGNLHLRFAGIAFVEDVSSVKIQILYLSFKQTSFAGFKKKAKKLST